MELYIQDRRSAMRDSTLDASPLCSVGQSSLKVAPVLNLFSGRGSRGAVKMSSTTPTRYLDNTLFVKA